MQLSSALDRFLVQLQADGRSPHTIRQYRRHIRRLGQWLADLDLGLDLSTLDPDVIARFLASDTARLRPDGDPKKPGAMNCLRSSIRSFFKYLSAAGTIESDPSRLVGMARCSGAPPRALTDSELRLLRHALASSAGYAARRDSLLVELLLATGLRISSALALRVDDIDLENRVAWIRVSKGSQESRVHLSPSIANALRDWLRHHPNGPLFDMSVRSAQRRFRQWVERAGLRPGLSLHSLRHTFATSLYKRTGDLLIVQQALHHRAIASTLVYARCDDERVRRAVGA